MITKNKIDLGNLEHELDLIGVLEAIINHFNLTICEIKDEHNILLGYEVLKEQQEHV